MPANQLELDHVFCFSSPNLPEAALVESAGFKVNAGTTHPGQGTANRCVIFAQNYLEFIFLSSLEEAQNNPLKLHLRTAWQKTGASPFGIALRGAIPESEKTQFWEYNPPYMKGAALLIHRQGNQFPILFQVPPKGESLASLWPSNRPNIDKALLEHPNGARNIVSLEVKGPGYEWPLKEAIKGIRFAEAPKPQLRVVLDGPTKLEARLNDLLMVETHPS